MVFSGAVWMAAFRFEMPAVKLSMAGTRPAAWMENSEIIAPAPVGSKIPTASSGAVRDLIGAESAKLARNNSA